MKKILFIIFVFALLTAVVFAVLYFQKKSQRGPELPGKIIPSETIITDGNVGE
jgi:hypothetical protein